MTSMKQVFIVPPNGRRQSWDVHAFTAKGRWVATWYCDGEEIAKLVAKRLKKGQAPGWAGYDSRKKFSGK